MSQEKKKHKIKPDGQPVDGFVQSSTPPEPTLEPPNETTDPQLVDQLSLSTQPVVTSLPEPAEAQDGQPISNAEPVDMESAEPKTAPADTSGFPPIDDPISAPPPETAPAVQAAPIREQEPLPLLNSGANPPPHKVGFSRAAIVGMLVFGNLLTLILALVIALAILANLNDGTLQFALPSDLPPLEQRITSLEASISQVNRDQAAIRTRLDNLEALSDRLGQVEKQNVQTREDLKNQTAEIKILSTQAISLTSQIGAVSDSVTTIEGQVTELQTASGRYQQFLDGLAQLLANILPQGK